MNNVANDNSSSLKPKGWTPTVYSNTLPASTVRVRKSRDCAKVQWNDKKMNSNTRARGHRRGMCTERKKHIFWRTPLCLFPSRALHFSCSRGAGGAAVGTGGAAPVALS